MRLFVALAIPPAVREKLAALVAELREVSSPAADQRPRWVRPENLHLTLKFIGEVPPAKLGSMRQVLAAVRSASAVDIDFRGLGFFPNEKRPRVFWAAMRASANLSTLAVDVDHATAAQGIAPETRPFSPHLTLARFEPPGVHDKLRAAIHQNMLRDFGSLRTAEFHLIESKLKPSGAQYTTLQSFRFAPES